MCGWDFTVCVSITPKHQQSNLTLLLIWLCVCLRVSECEGLGDNKLIPCCCISWSLNMFDLPCLLYVWVNKNRHKPKLFSQNLKKKKEKEKNILFISLLSSCVLIFPSAGSGEQVWDLKGRVWQFGKCAFLPRITKKKTDTELIFTTGLAHGLETRRNYDGKFSLLYSLDRTYLGID